MPFQFPQQQHGGQGMGHFAMGNQQHQQQQQHLPQYRTPHAPASSKVVETKYFVTRNGPLGTPGQASAAASFFARAHQKLGQQQGQCQSPVLAMQQHRPPRLDQQHIHEDSSEERQQFPTCFRTLVHRSPPQAPSSLLRKMEGDLPQQQQQAMGKIRVVARVSRPHTAALAPEEQNPSQYRHFQLDRRRRQITLYDPSAFRGPHGDVAPEERKVGVAAPKMFAFDGLFTSEDSHEDVCAVALPEVLQSVLNGSDGCVFCFGHASLGKTRSMLGSDQCAKDMGVIPVAIAWLYRAIKERKSKRGARFSVRVSALEIAGGSREDVRDLLAQHDTEGEDSPGMYLNHLPATGRCLQRQSELRASSAERAAHYLDAALAGRSLDAHGRESHLLYTLHVYQHGGRSRLHLIDFGGCERTKTPGGGITLSGLGNVLLGIFNGQKHLPHRDSKVTQVLRECLGSLSCQATMLAHVSPEACHYSETLHTVQLASRLHRMRRKRMKTSGHSSGGSTSSDEHRRLSKFKSHQVGGSGRRSSSDITTSGTSTAYSSSEMSCDTVVYRGQSDGSGTDSEHPPSLYLPASLRMINGISGNASAPGSLRGSFDDIPRPSSASSRRRRKILTNGAISPRRNLSPQPMAQQVLIHQQQLHHGSPNRSLSSLPVIHEVNTNSRKMPLNGLVPVPGRRRPVPPPPEEAGYQPRTASPLARSQSPVVRTQLQHQGRTPQGHVITASNVNQFQQQQQKSNEIWIDASPDNPIVSSNNVNNNVNNNNNNSHPSQQQQQEPLPPVLPSGGGTSSSSPSVQKKQYGYMDEHKQSMISTWVENQQSQEQLHDHHGNNGRFMTQFKIADEEVEEEEGQADARRGGGEEEEQNSDEKNSNSCQTTTTTVSAQVHAVSAPPKRCPPAPPPRRTPPREVRESSEGIITTLEALNHVIDDHENNNPMTGAAESLAPREEVEDDVDDDDNTHPHIQRFDNGNGHPVVDTEHPLRILSEENLTVVSSFGGSLENLDRGGDSHEEVDPSKLSFFEVPDFASMKENMDQHDNFISQRFREFAQLEKTVSPLLKKRQQQQEQQQEEEKEEEKEGDPLFKDPRFAEKETLLTFSRQNANRHSTRAIGNSSSSSNSNLLLKKKPLSSSSRDSSPRLPRRSPVPAPAPAPPMTPQKQFQLLAQSLRHPDGSSNPELNNAVVAERKPQPQRSPGNGKSSSDQENDETNANNTTPTGNNNSKVLAGAPRAGVAESPASSSSPVTPSNSGGKKESSSSSRFNFRFLRIFGSTRKLSSKKNGNESPAAEGHSSGKQRSKSCDGRNNNAAPKPPLPSSSFSASCQSSPSVKLSARERKERDKKRMVQALESNPNNTLGTPSVLSLATTEWEFQKEEGEEEEEEEVDLLPFNVQPGAAFLLHPHQMAAAGGGKKKPDRKSSGYDSLGGDESSSLDSNEEQQRRMMLRQQQQQQHAEVQPYALPSDKLSQLVQYDEIDIMRMEQRVKHVYN